MRRTASIFPKTSYHSTANRNPSQKLRFSAASNGEKIEHHSYIHLLNDPARIASINEAKCLHALVITMGSFPTQEPVFLHNNIIAKYAALGDISVARKVFDEMPHRNVVTYNSMISWYCRYGLLGEALGLFSGMRYCGLRPTQFTFGGLLSSRWLEVLEGMQLHALIEKTGLLYVDCFSGTALLGLYGRYGCSDEAIHMFESMPTKNLVTWNSMISVLGEMGCVEDCVFMFSEMMSSRVGLSDSTFVGILSCLQGVDMELGEQLHGLVIKHGFHNISSVYNCLINMYIKSGSTSLAEKMFENANVKDIVSWNILISAMGNGDEPIKALYFFRNMSSSRLTPNDTTLVVILGSCSRLHLLSCGESIHAIMIKKSYDSDVLSGSALVSFYSKCGKLQETHRCFDGLTYKSLVSWNSLMLGYSNSGSSFSTKLLQEMILSGYYPNSHSFSTAIKSARRTDLQQLHSLVIKMAYHDDAYVLTSLICSYARNDMVSDALKFVECNGTKLDAVSSNMIAWIYNRTGQYEKTQELYAAMENPDTISWNILIAACSRNGDYEETFELFDHMRRCEVCLNNHVFVSLFSVCTKLCDLGLGSSLHGLVMKVDFSSCDTFVCNVMIDMYGKCGSLESSVKVFNQMGVKNIISWTSLISALGLHGYANEAIDRFKEMEGAGVKPDKIAFMAVLSACRHIGLVKEGMSLFEEMKVKYGIEPDVDHYLVVIDLLTRYGSVKEAEQLILVMPMAPNALIWRSFLEGCKKQSTARSLALAA